MQSHAARTPADERGRSPGLPPPSVSANRPQLSWFMLAIRPSWSYRLNADFEDHAEHEYAHLVEEHAEWDSVPYDGAFAADFGAYDSLADLFRQIGFDERLHKVESELRMRQTRFG